MSKKQPGALSIVLQLDKKDGHVKTVRGDFYRVTLIVRKEGWSAPLLEIPGFRVSRDFRYLLPPSSRSFRGLQFPTVKVNPLFVRVLIDMVRSYMGVPPEPQREPI